MLVLRVTSTLFHYLDTDSILSVSRVGAPLKKNSNGYKPNWAFIWLKHCIMYVDFIVLKKHSALLIDNLYIFLCISNEYIFKKGNISSPQNKSIGVSRGRRRTARQLSNLGGCQASWEFSEILWKLTGFLHWPWNGPVDSDKHSWFDRQCWLVHCWSKWGTCVPVVFLNQHGFLNFQTVSYAYLKVMKSFFFFFQS